MSLQATTRVQEQLQVLRLLAAGIFLMARQVVTRVQGQGQVLRLSAAGIFEATTTWLMTTRVPFGRLVHLCSPAKR